MKTNRTPLRQLHMGCGERLLARVVPVLHNELSAPVLRVVRHMPSPAGKDKR